MAGAEDIISITIPIMTYDCLERLNKIICHPDYYNAFFDVELYLNLTEMGLLRDDRAWDTTTFQRKHYTNSKSELEIHTCRHGLFWSHDSEVFKRRKALPLEERLKVSKTSFD